jgi:hypothetical protein
MAYMKQLAQILIVQRFFAIVKDGVGMDERFQVFAHFFYRAIQLFHPSVKMIIVYEHNSFVFKIAHQ